MTGLLQHVEENIRNRLRLKSRQAVLVAVSGGLDSMALLHLLHRLSSRHRWQLTVAHFNHRLRGRSSDADEKLVRRMAAKLKLPVVVESAWVKAFGKKSGLSLEMAARKLRHEFLARAARERKIRIVALGHHADDQVELFFLRLFRGAGGEGLAGMKWSSSSPVDAKIRLIRPLLDTTREELRRFVRDHDIPFREDATNAGLEMPRNRIRNELLPLLRRHYQPALTRTVLRLMEITGAEADFTGVAAEPWLEKLKSASRPGLLRVRQPGQGNTFEGLPVAVQRRILQRQLIALNVPADFELVEQLRKSASVQVSAGSGIFVLRNGEGRVELHAAPPAEFNVREKAVELTGRAGRVKFDGMSLDWRLETKAGLVRPRPHANREFFDADWVGAGIRLRHWHPGDRFQPLGLKSAVKLQDLFTNAKISRARRRTLIVAVAADGRIFWVEGLRIGEGFELTGETRRRLVWRWRRAGGWKRQ